MSLHDVATIAGVTEACRYNDHSMCNNPACACTCHKPAPSKAEQEAKAEIGPENACPKCGVKRPSNELFCRIDGTRLTSLACNMCGRGMNPEDAFCFNCGAPKGAVGQVNKLPQVVTVPVDIDNIEQQVLKGLQEELSVQQEPQDRSQPAPQVVVEQPAGTQGSFKIVSAPNPNKVRVPKPSSPQVRPAIRLPVKPS